MAVDKLAIAAEYKIQEDRKSCSEVTDRCLSFFSKHQEHCNEQ
ncbi:hypothetical protein KSS87_023426 [Heliosperma pusillum]|nr:hypothetical protein KSS87_023426 [Heliosperma pusillum]